MSACISSAGVVVLRVLLQCELLNEEKTNLKTLVVYLIWANSD